MGKVAAVGSPAPESFDFGSLGTFFSTRGSVRSVEAGSPSPRLPPGPSRSRSTPRAPVHSLPWFLCNTLDGRVTEAYVSHPAQRVAGSVLWLRIGGKGSRT